VFWSVARGLAFISLLVTTNDSADVIALRCELRGRHPPAVVRKHDHLHLPNVTYVLRSRHLKVIDRLYTSDCATIDKIMINDEIGVD